MLLPCRWCGLLLQGADNPWCAVRAPDAVDRGTAARWWLNPSPSQCAALACPACSGHAVVTRCPHPSPGGPCPACMAAASGGCSAYRVASPARGCVLPDKQPGKGPRTPQFGWAAPCLGAAPNSQGWGPQDPKRPVGPPFSGTLSLLSPTGYVAPVLFPAASAMSVRRCRTRGSSTRPQQGPCAVACVCW